MLAASDSSVDEIRKSQFADGVDHGGKKSGLNFWYSRLSSR